MSKRDEYAERQKAFDSIEAANDACQKFVDGVYQLANQHGISCGFLVCEIRMWGDEPDSSPLEAMIPYSFGDHTRVERLAAYGFGWAQSKRQEMISKAIGETAAIYRPKSKKLQAILQEGRIAMSDKATGYINVHRDDNLVERINLQHVTISSVDTQSKSRETVSFRCVGCVEGGLVIYSLTDQLRAELRREGIPIPGETQETLRVETTDEWVLAIARGSYCRLYINGAAATRVHYTNGDVPFLLMRSRCDRVVHVECCISPLRTSDLTIIREEKP